MQQIADNPEFGNLHDKLAVIYFDGNKFSNIVRACNTAEELDRFDKKVQEYRKGFLRDLIDLSLKV